MRAEDARMLLCMLAARAVGDYLYSWGGESGDEGGFDCSGYVSEVLRETARSYPVLYDGARRTARGIHAHFEARRADVIIDRVDLRPGCLVFFRRPGREIHHVLIHVMTVPPTFLAGRTREIGPVGFEAGGAGSTAVSPREALRRAAGIRLTASDYHGDGIEWVALDPFTAGIDGGGL